MPYACLVQNMYPHTLEGESAMFKMFARDPIVLGMDTMFNQNIGILVIKTLTLIWNPCIVFMVQMATRVLNAGKKVERTYTGKSPLTKDAVLFGNHNKTGFASNFLPGNCVAQKIDDSNYVIKHTFSG